MTCRPLVLASASPARLRLLRDAGFDPTVMVSGVDEQAVTADDPRELVRELARRKAEAVATGLQDALVVGADSMLLLDGQTHGKPRDDAEARARWLRMRGRTGTLLTGQAVIDVASGRTSCGVAATEVR
ncbi:MAG: Maf family nucleotide pyrophosphatase, partial [Actinomycetota bacterium]|nr:Maf family nucleotide pyrophosphatase [Actinomycetota bacterium]